MQVDKLAIAKKVAKMLEDDVGEIIDNAVVEEVELPEGYVLKDDTYYNIINDIICMVYRGLARNHRPATDIIDPIYNEEIQQ